MLIAGDTFAWRRRTFQQRITGQTISLKFVGRLRPPPPPQPYMQPYMCTDVLHRLWDEPLLPAGDITKSQMRFPEIRRSTILKTSPSSVFIRVSCLYAPASQLQLMWQLLYASVCKTGLELFACKQTKRVGQHEISGSLGGTTIMFLLYPSYFFRQKLDNVEPESLAGSHFMERRISAVNLTQIGWDIFEREGYIPSIPRIPGISLCKSSERSVVLRISTLKCCRRLDMFC